MAFLYRFRAYMYILLLWSHIWLYISCNGASWWKSVRNKEETARKQILNCNHRSFGHTNVSCIGTHAYKWILASRLQTSAVFFFFLHNLTLFIFFLSSSIFCPINLNVMKYICHIYYLAIYCRDDWRWNTVHIFLFPYIIPSRI